MRQSVMADVAGRCAEKRIENQLLNVSMES